MDNNFNNVTPEQVTPNPEATQPMQPDMGEPVQSEMSQQPYGEQMQPEMSQQPYEQPVRTEMNQQPYGQQMQPEMNLQPYVQSTPPTATNPLTGGNGGGGKPPKVKKPMTGGKLAAIICGGIAAVAAIVCGVIFIPKLFRTDKEVVIDAFEATLNTDAESTYIEDTVGIADIMEKLEENGGTITSTISIDKYNDTDFNLGVETYAVTNPKDKLVEYTIAAIADGEPIIKLNMFGDDTNTYVEIQDFIDGYFMVPNDDPMGAYNSSYLGQEAPITGANVQFDYFPDEETTESTDNINSGYVNAIEELWDSAEFEKQGKAKINVNGKTVKAKEYTVTLKEENIENALVSVFDGVKQMYADDPSLLEESGMDLDTFNSSMAQVQNLIPSLVTGDFVVKVYVKDDKIIKITSSDDISLMGVTMSYNFFLDIEDEDVSGECTFTVMGESVGIKFEAHDLNGNANGKFTVEVPGEDAIELTYTSTVNKTDSAEDVSFEIELNMGTENLAKISGKAEMDKTANSFNIAADCTADGETMQFLMSGKLEDINKGVSYKYAIDNITVTAGEESLTMSASYSVDTSANTAKPYDSSKPVYELATLTEDDFNNIIMENEDLAVDWIMNLNEYLSPIIGDLQPESVYEEADISGESDIISESVDDGIIEEGNVKVRILGSLPGLTCSYDGSYYITYADAAEDFSVNYSIYNDMSAEEVVSLYYFGISSEGEVTEELNSTMTLSDGSTVNYSYSMGDYCAAMYAKDLGNGSCIVADVYVYNQTASSAELGEALLDSNFEVIE